MASKTPSKTHEEEDFIHVEICIKTEDIQAIADAAGYAGETVNKEIEYCMKKMSNHLKQQQQNTESTRVNELD